MHLTNPTAHHLKYRSDIDGLRAVAVLAVVGFHAFPSWVHGGFVGVDIFFVISGFLISSIIFLNLEKDKFSIIDFYDKRIRRIFPALLVVMLGSLVFGWHLLLVDEYKQLGKHLVSGVAFITNFILWKESSYFDNVAETKPMLHLWSLAVEEQFYIFWPILLSFFWGRRRVLGLAIALILAGSFGMNIYWTSNHPDAAFYLPMPRFWELLAGAVLAYIAMYKPAVHQRYPNEQSFAGAALLVVGLVYIDKTQHFPGWLALLPVIGAFLLISAGPNAWVNRHVLGSKVLVSIGLISYPLYLWHWPLLSFAHILELNSPEIKLAAVFLSFVLAIATYFWVEKPVRFGAYGKEKSFALLGSMLLVGVGAGYIYAQNGLARIDGGAVDRPEFYRYFSNIPNGRLVEVFEKNFRHDCNFSDIQKEISGDKNRTPKDEIPSSCYARDTAKYDKAVFIWGDSHAQMLNFGLTKNLQSNWQVLQVASSGCRPSVDVASDSSTSSCVRSNWFALKAIAQARPDVVVVAQRAGHSEVAAQLIKAKLTQLGVAKVVFTGPTPEWDSDLPKIIVRKLWNDTAHRSLEGIDATILEKDRLLKKSFNDTRLLYVSLVDVFCSVEGCMTFIGDDRKNGITTWDYGHLTPVASDYLSRSVLARAVAGN